MDDINELRLVTATDIGRLIGVSRAWAHELTKTEGFPSPVYRTRVIALWQEDSVQEWARRTGYLEEY